MSDLAKLESDLDAELKERARRDILAFTLYTKEDYEIGWHHRYLAKKLNDFAFGRIRFLMVFMPPRHGKSELVSRRLPAFLHGLYPDAEIMAVSYLDSLAGDMTIDVQKIIESPDYKNLFPKTTIYPVRTPYTQGIRNSSEHHIVGHKGKYRGQGIGGSFTGRGSSFCLIDDPIKGREIADSQAFRDRLWNFYTNDLFTRLETNLQTGRTGQVLITLTRWHEDDLAGRLLNLMYKDPQAVQWDVVNFPAIRVDLDNPDDPREIGEALWPEKYDIEQLNQIKAGTTARGWSAVYQQSPVPGDGNYFKEHMFEYCDLPGGYDWTFITADTAYKEKQHNDFTVFTAWGVKGEQPFIIDVFREQMPAMQIETAVEPFIRKYSAYGFRGAYIEPKGHGIYLNQLFARKGIMVPSESEIQRFYSDRKHDKVERANNVIPHLARRKVFLSKNIKNKEALVAECLGFPNMKHDDFVDTLVDGLKRIYGHAVSILDFYASPKRY